MIGTVFDIQRFSVHDGPGIRTTVFMKGCSLRCAWCHNPEGLSPEPQLKFDKSNCIRCGRCSTPPDFSDPERCPTGALSVCGTKVTAKELLTELLRDKIFYGDDGGVTFSGGECLLQSDFVTSVMKELKKENIGTAIDTAGFVPYENIEQTLEYCDLYLYDLKAASSVIHKKYTGHNNSLIVSNLEKLCLTGKKIRIRIPVIPDVNDSAEEMTALNDIIRGCTKNTDGSCIERITLIPYHTLGKSKYPTLGMSCRFNTEKNVSPEKTRHLSEIFGNKALSTIDDTVSD